MSVADSIIRAISDIRPTELWPLRLPQKAARLIALLRFPTNKQQRKRLRYQLLENFELGELARPEHIGPGKVASEDIVAGSLLSAPMVSAIIPNYNHARFLERRIDSIVDQRWPIGELIILDDASTDRSLEVIERRLKDLDVPWTIIRNTENSGSIFKQWIKGLAVAKGDLIWICESDDDCDEGFLEALVPYFCDRSVMLAFGAIDFIDQDGKPRADMNRYMDYSGFFGSPRIASANAWFNGPFGLKCLIKNVGGCVFRKRDLGEEMISELVSFRTCGDWFFYSQIARAGKIAFDPRAKASFRVHGKNASVSSFGTEAYYKECLRVLQAFRRSYDLDERTVRTALQNFLQQCQANLGEKVARQILPRSTYSGILAERPST